MDVHISNNAAEYIKNNISNYSDQFALRVYVKSAGCCSVNLGAAFDEIRQSDNIYQVKGIKIIIDKKMARSIKGFKIDVVNTVLGYKLVIEDMYKGSCR